MDAPIFPTRARIRVDVYAAGIVKFLGFVGFDGSTKS